MSIPPISVGIPSVPTGVGSPGAAPAGGFGGIIGDTIADVSAMEFEADAAIQDIASGGETSVHELMTATSKAQLGIEVMSTIRDKAVEAYQEIMRMQV